MTFWCGSGSCDPAIFVIDLQDAKKNNIKKIFCLLLFEGTRLHSHNFSKIKSQKESQKSSNKGFSYYFCMMIEGSGSRSGSGSIPLTNGSGSGSKRPKNMWIRWIQIRIRISNTGGDLLVKYGSQLKRYRSDTRWTGLKVTPVDRAQVVIYSRSIFFTV
jgi:hypothetical protein